MIGDSDRDVEAGKNAGCLKSVKVETNDGEELLEVVKELV
jgi:D-glycero-D-manno-heptose 1,7-bisphosphate phosphatase